MRKKIVNYENGQIIELKDKEIEKLLSLNENIKELKSSFAELEIQIMSLEEKKEKIFKDLNNKGANYINEAKKLAKSHGIDIDKPEAGQWSIDLDKKSMTKIS